MTEARTTAHRRRSYGTPRRFLGHVLLAFLHFCAAGGSAVPLKKPPFLTGRRLADMSIHGASRNLLAPTTSPPATTAPPTPDTNDTASGPALVNLQCVSQGSKQLCPFVDPLPRPGTVTARGGIKMGMYEVTQQMHQDLPETSLFGYGTSPGTATSPGPTLEATWGTPVQVLWENQIGASAHPLRNDPDIMQATPKSGVPAVVHLHGGEVSSLSDGNPDAWYTKGGEKGPAYTGNVYTYVNTQDPATLWYHDHTMGYTRLNVQMGLAGFYLLRKPDFENKLNLPRRGFEIPLAIKDYSFNADGSVFYPSSGSGNKKVWVPEFFGDTIVVNGNAWPYLEVLRRKYRFRILNACNSRFLDLSFDSGGLIFYQVGTDGGYLTTPVTRKNILLGPGERADVIVDFKGLAPDTEIVLKNSAVAPYPNGNPPTDNGQFGGTAEVMKFIVRKKIKKNVKARKSKPSKFEPAADATVAETALDDAQVPGFMQTLPDLKGIAPTIVERWLTLNEDLVNGSPNAVLLGNLVAEKSIVRFFRDPVTETPKQGGTELWNIINLTGDTHPIHVHLVKLRLVSRYSFDNAKYQAGGCKFDTKDPASSCVQLANPLPIDDNEAGWKDTVRMNPGQVSTIVLRFASQNGASFGFDPTQGPGYVWHCHIIDHEDNEMMRPFKVQK